MKVCYFMSLFDAVSLDGVFQHVLVFIQSIDSHRLRLKLLL